MLAPELHRLLPGDLVQLHLHLREPGELDFELPGAVRDAEFHVLQFLPEVEQLLKMPTPTVRSLGFGPAPLLALVDVSFLFGAIKGALGRVREGFRGLRDLVDDRLHPPRLLPVRGWGHLRDGPGWTLGRRGREPGCVRWVNLRATASGAVAVAVDVFHELQGNASRSGVVFPGERRRRVMVHHPVGVGHRGSLATHLGLYGILPLLVSHDGAFLRDPGCGAGGGRSGPDSSGPGGRGPGAIASGPGSTGSGSGSPYLRFHGIRVDQLNLPGFSCRWTLISCSHTGFTLTFALTERATRTLRAVARTRRRLARRHHWETPAVLALGPRDYRPSVTPVRRPRAWRR